MAQTITEADVSAAIDRAFGRAPKSADSIATILTHGRKSAEEAAVDVAVAQAFGRTPDVRDVAIVREAAKAAGTTSLVVEAAKRLGEATR